MKDYMRSFQDLAKANGFQFLVVPVPCRDDPKKSMRVLREALGADAAAENPAILDITQPLQETLLKDRKKYEEMFWVHDNHLSPYGNQVFARALYETLRNARLTWDPFP